MLNCDKWSIMDLNVQFLSSKYIDYRKGCPALPPHMGLCIAPVDTLPMNVEEADSELDVDVEKETHFTDTEQDDAGPPIENQNCSGGEIEKTLFCDIAENQSETLDVNGEPVASVPHAPFNAQPLVNTMDWSTTEVTILGDIRQAVDYPADDDYTIRKGHMGYDELSPICYRQEPTSSLSVQVDASVSVDLHHILDTSPRNLRRSKDMALEDARGQSKSKSTSEVSESEDVERRSNPYGDDCLQSFPEVLLSSPFGNGANGMPSKSPFSAFLEQYPVKPPSSIVRRCLEQKSKANNPDSSESIRNLTSEGLPENLPSTPPIRTRVVVVIPDFTPIASSRDVIDLTDSPF